MAPRVARSSINYGVLAEWLIRQQLTAPSINNELSELLRDRLSELNDVGTFPTAANKGASLLRAVKKYFTPEVLPSGIGTDGQWRDDALEKLVGHIAGLAEGTAGTPANILVVFGYKTDPGSGAKDRDMVDAGEGTMDENLGQNTGGAYDRGGSSSQGLSGSTSPAAPPRPSASNPYVSGEESLERALEARSCEARNREDKLEEEVSGSKEEIRELQKELAKYRQKESVKVEELRIKLENSEAQADHLKKQLSLLQQQQQQQQMAIRLQSEELSSLKLEAARLKCDSDAADQMNARLKKQLSSLQQQQQQQNAIPRHSEAPNRQPASANQTPVQRKRMFHVQVSDLMERIRSSTLASITFSPATEARRLLDFAASSVQEIEGGTGSAKDCFGLAHHYLERLQRSSSDEAAGGDAGDLSGLVTWWFDLGSLKMVENMHFGRIAAES
jgi:hypothetical protein